MLKTDKTERLFKEEREINVLKTTRPKEKSFFLKIYIYIYIYKIFQERLEGDKSVGTLSATSVMTSFSAVTLVG